MPAARRPIHLAKHPKAVGMPGSVEAMVQGLNRGVRRQSARWQFVREAGFGGELTVRGFRLGNGLTVWLMVDRSAPVVSYQTWFRVGSRHERTGKTGLAHLFEHLMFNETANLKAGQFDRLLEAAGGETNAATWLDWTYYHDSLPAAELPLAVRLEADRMAHLVLREPQVASEKEVVANERRQRVDDDVGGTMGERLYAGMFPGHPYGWPTIGWMQDIEGFTVEDCRRFYRTFYAPNNATLVIAGDLDEAHTLSLLQAHYGAYRSAKIPTERAAKPPAPKPFRLSIPWATPSEKLLLGYRATAFGSADWAPLSVLCDIWVGGRSARLHRLLVHEHELVTDIGGSVAPLRDPGLLELSFSMREGKSAKQALALLDAELLAVQRQGVRAEELEKAINRFELSFLSGMETAHGKAEQIGFYASVLGDVGGVFRQLEAVRAVTAAQVQKAAKRYLRQAQRGQVLVVPR